MPTLKRLGNNMHEVQCKHATFFFSYETCVGIEHHYTDHSTGLQRTCFVDECPVYGSESGISRTTARHIKKWLDGRKPTYVDHDTFLVVRGNLV